MVIKNYYLPIVCAANLKNMFQNCVLSIEDEDTAQGINITKRKRTQQSLKGNVAQLLQLISGKKVEGRNVSNEDGIKRIELILETNKCLLTDQYWADNKVKSILHFVKFESKMRYTLKQQIINMIIDVGYRLFKFSENAPLSDICHSLFFVAAKGDLKVLKKIINYFRDNNLPKIYDTREGDTIISFMVKFGDHFHKDFLRCFKLVLEEGIDVERDDYYKNNVKEVIRKEIQFLERNKIGGGYMNNLTNIRDYVDEFAKVGQDYNSRINYKYKLFHAIINEQNNFKHVLKPNLVDSDDGQNTLLQLAIIKNNVEIARELLSMGANPNLVVDGRNEEVPVVLAAKLQRDNIFKEILMNKGLEISNAIFAKFVKELKRKYLNALLQLGSLNVDFEYNGKTPLHYAILDKNKEAVQSLLQRGSRVDDICLQNINPKDLEDYFNSCIKFDNFKKDFEEGNFKLFLVFDFFMKSFRKHSEKDTIRENSSESRLLVTISTASLDKFESEVAIIKRIGNIKRLKRLLEHPLVYIYIMLKWYCALKYYYYLTIAKSIFYIMICLSIYLSDSFNYFFTAILLLVQCGVVSYNCSVFKLEFAKYTLHFILEILIFICLVTNYILKFLNRDIVSVDIVNQISAFLIIFVSVSMLLTIGYHLKLSKWIAMGKRVFKNFSILLLFFMLPINAFAVSFMLLYDNKTNKSKNDVFSNYYRSIFRTLIMISGEVGDTEFTSVGSYFIFMLFIVGVAIMLLNFWIGIAVANINEIEEQSTIVAFQQVILYMESAEIMYKFIFDNKFFQHTQVPSLKSRLSKKPSKKDTFYYGIDFYINSRKQFKSNKYFKECKIPINVVSKIKSLHEDDKTKSLDAIIRKLNEIEMLLEVHNNKNQQL